MMRNLIEKLWPPSKISNYGRVLATENFFINGLTVKQFVGRVFEWFSMRIIRITVSKITKKDYENWI